MKRITGTALAVGAALTLLAQGATAQTVWRFSSYIPVNHPLNAKLIAPWGKDLERVTQGRVTLQIIPALGPPQAHFDLVKNGVADVAMPVANYTPQRMKLQGLAELPFTSDTSLAPSVALQRTHDRFFSKANEFDGVTLGAIWAHGPAHLYTVSKPVRGLADIRNMKIRSAGGISNSVVELMGAQPFFAPVNQAYEVLSKGVADGLVFPHESVPSFKLEGVLKHGVIVPGGLYQSVHYLAINPGKLNALSPADKAAVQALLGEPLARKAGTVWDESNEWGLGEMKKAGMNFSSPDAAMTAELKARLAGLLEGWYKDAAAKNVDGKAAYTFFRENVQQLEAAMGKKS
jgi:TRAP-type C4-dicarboxylate transport system substrate-binding protein